MLAGDWLGRDVVIHPHRLGPHLAESYDLVGKKLVASQKQCQPREMDGLRLAA
jgi:hypothetical protein